MRSFDPQSVKLSGQTLVEASAGTGKTHSITVLFARMIGELGLTVDQVLVVTFTEAATAELRDRLRTSLKNLVLDFEKGAKEQIHKMASAARVSSEQVVSRISTALRDFDQASVQTIHGFCGRILREYAYETGRPFEMELMTSSAELLEEISADFWAKKTYDASRLLVSQLLSNKLDPSGLESLAQILLSRPVAELLGPTDDRVDEKPYRAAYDKVREQWLQHGEVIRACLTESPGINRVKFKLASLQNWFEAVDHFVEDEVANHMSVEKDFIFKFTSSNIERVMNKNKVAPVHPFFDACEDLLLAHKDLNRRLAQVKLEFAQYLNEQMAIRKEERGVQFFDDLLQGLDSAISHPVYGQKLITVVTDKFKAALIDEFQDTDQIQYRIFSRLFEKINYPFFLIGDPKQSIYAFRGGDIFTYMEVANKIGGSAYTLGTNWRSDPGLIDAVNALFGRLPNPFIYEHIRFPKVSARPGAKDILTGDSALIAPMEIQFVSRDNKQGSKSITSGWMEKNIPDCVAADIARLLMSDVRIGENPVTPSDIAVLVQTNNQATMMQEALKVHGITSVQRSGASVFHSKEAGELSQIMEAAAAPREGEKIKAALGTVIMGLDANSILNFEEDDAQWGRWFKVFSDWKKIWDSRGFVQMMDSILSLKGEDGQTIRARVLSGPAGERSLTNLRQLIELIHERSRAEGGGVLDLLRWFENLRDNDASQNDKYQQRIESDRDTVKISTVHKSKGLQYPIVYLPFFWKGITKGAKSNVFCHLPKDGFKEILDLGSDDLEEHLSLASDEQRAEKIRLLYVAATRAKHQLKIVWGAAAGFDVSALGYVLYGSTLNPDPKKLPKELKSLSDSALLESLEKFASNVDGKIRISKLREDTGVLYLPPQETQAPLSFKKMTRSISSAFWVSSYSAITESSHRLDPDQSRGRDWDVGPANARIFELSNKQINHHKPVSQKIALGDFPAGAAAGSCIHEIFENIVFDDVATVPRICEEKLQKYNYPVAQWGDILSDAIVKILNTPLDRDNSSTTLGNVAEEKKLVEMEFMLPLDSERPVESVLIAEIFARHAGTFPMNENYASRMEAMHFRPLSGFFKGFVDLIFERDGRYYLLDYKSNYLGATYEHYDQAALRQAMDAHNYYLQYHLYSVALHRYLAGRISGYDYERHFGGVYYLFVRGMSPNNDSSFGIFKDRPSVSLVRELSSLFAAPDEGYGGDHE